MTYFLKEKIENILNVERTIFLNLLLILDAYYIGSNYSKNKKINITNQFLEQLNNRFGRLVNLQKISLNNIELKNMKYLVKMNLAEANLQDLSFDGSDLRSSIIENAKIQNVSFCNAVLDGTTFNCSIFSNVRMSSTHVYNCSFISCTIDVIEDEKSYFNNCVFKNAKLNNAHFKNSNLYTTCFRNAILKGADFSGSTLYDIDLSGADLTGANLHFVKISKKHQIKINEKTIFNNAKVDSTLVSMLLKYTPNNLKELQVYDIQKNKYMSLEEYQSGNR